MVPKSIPRYCNRVFGKVLHWLGMSRMSNRMSFLRSGFVAEQGNDVRFWIDDWVRVSLLGDFFP